LRLLLSAHPTRRLGVVDRIHLWLFRARRHYRDGESWSRLASCRQQLAGIVDWNHCDRCNNRARPLRPSARRRRANHGTGSQSEPRQTNFNCDGPITAAVSHCATEVQELEAVKSEWKKVVFRLLCDQLHPYSVPSLPPPLPLRQKSSPKSLRSRRR
jgi:hypothetical protein